MPQTSMFDIAAVRKIWMEQAEKHGVSHTASEADACAVDLEIRTVLEYLESGERALQVGCRAGYAAVQYAAHKEIRILGVDRDKKMIKAAGDCLYPMRTKIEGEIKFEQSDITVLSFCHEVFDKIITSGAVAALQNRGSHKPALAECARVLKPGGLLLLSEPTTQGLENLNRFRAEFGLPPLPAPESVPGLDMKTMNRDHWPDLDLVEVREFSSTYSVASLVFKPLLDKAAGNAAATEDEFNRFAAEAPSWGDYGVKKLFVFRKANGRAEDRP